MQTLSEGWREERFDSLTNNLDNKRVPLNNSQRAEKEGSGAYPYVGANNILCSIDEYIFDEKILCIAEDGGAWGYKEKCAFIMNEKCWVNNHAHVVTAKDGVVLEYLCYYLNYADLSLHINGATRGKLNQSALNKIKIPLPPLAEQQKIAAILHAADSLRQKDQQLIEHYTALSQSLFLEMFGDPVSNPMGWEFSKLEELVTKLGDGLHGTPIYNEEGEYYFINGNNLHHGRIEFTSTTKKVSQDEFIKHKKELNESTMLVSINGTIGKVAFFKGEKIILGKSACYFNVKEALINKIFLFYLIEAPYFIKYASGMATGSTIKNVSLKTMREFPIPMPPITLQNQFAKRIQAIEVQKQQAQASLEKSETLFNSLLQRAFKGELTA
jgi:type I restriction enzyme S subunit